MFPNQQKLNITAAFFIKKYLKPVKFFGSPLCSLFIHQACCTMVRKYPNLTKLKKKWIIFKSWHRIKYLLNWKHLTQYSSSRLSFLFRPKIHTECIQGKKIYKDFFLTSFFSVLAYLDIADCGGTTRQGLPLRPLPPILTFNLTEIWTKTY